MITEYSEITGVPEADILGRSRIKRIALHRSVYWWLLHEIGFNNSQLGRICDREASVISRKIIQIKWAIKYNTPEIMEIVNKTKHLIEIYKKVKL